MFTTPLVMVNEANFVVTTEDGGTGISRDKVTSSLPFMGALPESSMEPTKLTINFKNWVTLLRV